MQSRVLISSKNGAEMEYTRRLTVINLLDVVQCGLVNRRERSLEPTREESEIKNREKQPCRQEKDSRQEK